MVEGVSYTPILIITKEIGSKTRLTDTDTTSIKLARAMKVSGKTIDKMDTGLNNGVMVHGTKGCMQMETRMAQATSCGMIPRCL